MPLNTDKIMLDITFIFGGEIYNKIQLEVNQKKTKANQEKEKVNQEKKEEIKPSERAAILKEIAEMSALDSLEYKKVADKMEERYETVENYVYGRKYPVFEYKIVGESSGNDKVLLLREDNIRQEDTFEIYKIRYKDFILIKKKHLKDKSITKMQDVIGDYKTNGDYVYIIEQKTIDEINKIKID